MFNEFDEEARRVLVRAKEEMLDLKHPYVGSEHLLLALLKTDSKLTKELNNYKINYNNFKKELINIVGKGTKKSEWFLYTPLLKRVLENAVIDSKELGSNKVTINHLFSSLLEEGEGVAIRILIGMNINIDDLYNNFSSKILAIKTDYRESLLIDEIGNDLTKQAQEEGFDPVVGRDNETKRVIEILSRRTKNNPILIGPAGVGKTAVVEELSRLIALGEVPMFLKNKKIISINMASIVSGTKYRGEFEERMNKILTELENDRDVILFIDEIHTLVGAGGAEGAIDASNIIKPALSRNKIRIIGATTTNEYNKYIEPDKALSRRFQQVYINEPDEQITKKILISLKPLYEKYHNVIINQEIIDKIIELSNKYIHDRNNPDKVIDILDEVCAHVGLKESNVVKKYNKLKHQLRQIIDEKNKLISSKDFKSAKLKKIEENKLLDKINQLEIELYKKKPNIVTIKDVAKVINIKTKVPVYEVLGNNKLITKNITKSLKNIIVGQDNAVNKLVSLYKKIKLGLKDNNCYSLMFCGPSGVGKTELAKQFGKYLVGDENVIKLDMSEYSTSDSINKLLGSSPGYIGYDDNNSVFELIRTKPHSVLILDEIEKASPKIINLFLQILEDGKIKNNKGITINFNQVIIIMTSNAGYTHASIGFEKDSNINSKLNETFSTPFINRIDDIITFNRLQKRHIIKLIKTKLNKLKEDYLTKNVIVDINENVINEIVTESNYDIYGARSLDKIINKSLDNKIIDCIVMGKQQISINTIRENVLQV